MKTKLGTSAGTGDSSNLDNIFAMVEEKKKENKELEEMKEKADKERVGREEEIKRLKEEEMAKKEGALIKDIEKFKVVAKSEFGKEFAAQAWDSLLEKWGIEKGGINRGDTKSLKKRLNISASNTDSNTDFEDNGDGTITDFQTGLMWQKEDDKVQRHFDYATSYCDSLTLAGYSDWRLPTIDELKMLIDKSFKNPTIDTTFFPNTNSSSYWSSSTYAGSTSSAWGMYFGDGYVYYNSKSNSYYVMCVRN